MIHKPPWTNLGFRCWLVQDFSLDDRPFPELIVLLWWIDGEFKAIHCVHPAEYGVDFGVPLLHDTQIGTVRAIMTKWDMLSMLTAGWDSAVIPRFGPDR